MSRTVLSTNLRDALRTDIAAGPHAFVADEPERAGGSDAGTRITTGFQTGTLAA